MTKDSASSSATYCTILSYLWQST